MNITLENLNGTSILRLHEERLDAHNSQEFKEKLLRLPEGGGAVVVDLSEVRFVDSSGLGVLLSGHKNARLRDGRFALVGVQARVQSMFELTRLHRVFEIHSTVDDALANLAGEASNESQQDQP
jgi:anti-sigma B factor antagonist